MNGKDTNTLFPKLCSMVFGQIIESIWFKIDWGGLKYWDIWGARMNVRYDYKTMEEIWKMNFSRF